jgi:hypothetical protein
MENFALSFNPASLRTIVLRVFDLLTPLLAGQNISQEDMAQIRQLTVDSVDVLGGSLAFAYLPAPKGKPPFAVREVVSIKDKQKLYQLLESSAKMMNEGTIANLCKSLGCKVQMELKRNAGTYKGVPVDAMRFTMQPPDTNSPQGRVMKEWCDEGSTCGYVVGNLALYASQSPAPGYPRLIDQPRRAAEPGPASPGSPQLIPDAKISVVRTYNIVLDAMMATTMARVSRRWTCPRRQRGLLGRIAAAMRESRGPEAGSA